MAVEQTPEPSPEELDRTPTPERRCEVCEVRLSAYNPGPNCWQHTIGRPWRGPSAKPRF